MTTTWIGIAIIAALAAFVIGFVTVDAAIFYVFNLKDKIQREDS